MRVWEAEGLEQGWEQTGRGLPLSHRGLTDDQGKERFFSQKGGREEEEEVGGGGDKQNKRSLLPV